MAQADFAYQPASDAGGLPLAVSVFADRARVRAEIREDAAAVGLTVRECGSVAALLDALRNWLDACDTAGFDEPVSLAVAREAWLTGVDEPGLNRRFRAGVQFGVNYTLGLSNTGNTGLQQRLEHAPDGTISMRADQQAYEELNKTLSFDRHLLKANFVWDFPDLEADTTPSAQMRR